ncbi:MAG: hypothetical protein WCZ72_08175, partial [Gemmobacter sp.]
MPTMDEIMRRALEADDIRAETERVICELRDENGRQGGDMRAFDILLCSHLGWLAHAIPVRKAGSNPSDKPVEVPATGGR